MAALYIAAAWLIMQVAENLIELGNADPTYGRFVLIALAVGFPIALVLSWFYELTPEGISLEKDVAPGESIKHITGRRMDFIVIALLSAAVVLFAWHTWWPSAPVDRSIAVMPFENMSDDPGNDYFSNGVAEQVITLLTQVPDLDVIASSSAFYDRGQGDDNAAIVDKLKVAYFLEGSVRKSGDQVRITAQLIEADTNRHLWSETYDRELANIFAIQDEIAAAIVDALEITVLREKPRSTQTTPEAYSLYLQARYLVNQGTVESFAQAETLLKKTLAIDPEFAPAWADLGFVYWRQTSNLGIRPIRDGSELARHAIQKSLAIDPQIGRAYAVLSLIATRHDWDFAAASEHVRKARTLNPSDAFVVDTASRLSTILGRIDEAIDLSRQATVLDPVFPAYGWLGYNLLIANRLDEAAAALEIGNTLFPGSLVYRMVFVRLAQGDASAALVAAEQVADDDFRLTATAIAHHALANAPASDAALRELIEKSSEDMAFQIAQVYACRGEIDHAFGWLERAYEDRDAGLAGMLAHPNLTNLHDDPRWAAFLDKMGLPH